MILLYQPSQTHTIPRKSPTPLPYERSVCFASCKTSGVQLRASMPVPCQRRGADAHKNSGDYRRDCYITKPSQNRTIPSPRTKLASLVKGRWIDGKAQALILLLSACDMSTLFMLQTFLPSRRRDCLPLHRILLPSQPLQKDNTPSLRTKLASPKVNFCCSVKPSQLQWGL